MKVLEVLAKNLNPNVVGSGIIVDPNYKEAPIKAKTPPVPAAPQAVPKPAPVTGKPPIPSAQPKLAVTAKAEPASFNPGDYRDLIIKLARQRGFKTDAELSKLLGQISHETLNWGKSVESMTYSDPGRIRQFFTRAFPTVQAAIPYVNNPVALANKVYATVLGNGNEASGDGWTYRGRGFMHITGRENYLTAGQVTHPENPTIYVDNPYLLSTNPQESAISAIEFYKKKIGFGKTTKQVSTIVNKKAGHKQRQVATNQELSKLQAAKTRPNIGQQVASR